MRQNKEDILIVVHPGEILVEFMNNHNINLDEFSKKTKISRYLLEKICDGYKPITTLEAYKISKVYKKLKYKFLMNLQINYDYDCLKYEDPYS